MENTYSLLRSKTFWTIVVMALLPVLNTIVPTLPTAWQSIAEIILGALASAFHQGTAIRSGAVN